MKKFLKNFLNFFLVFAITSSLTLIILVGLFKFKLSLLHFEKQTTTLICGDSHTASAVIDSLLVGVVNISSHSQHYFYTFNVIQALLENNPQIDTIILGSSFHSFSGYDEVLYNDTQAGYSYPIYFPILDFESSLFLLKNNFLVTLKSSRNIVLSYLKYLKSHDLFFNKYPFIGYYYKSKNNNISNIVISNAIKRHYFKNDSIEHNFSNIQLKYFEKIIDFCQKKNIKIIIINTPIHDDYYSGIPKKFISQYYLTMSKFNNSAKFWDLHNLKLDSTSFGDGDHLNTKGAIILTHKLDSLRRL